MAVREWHIAADSKAPAEALYDQLADLHRHLDWGGEDQMMNFKLLTLDPETVAMEGTEFTSTGGIPMSSLKFSDHSRVTSAERPTRFGFTTESEVALPGDKKSESTWTHLYEITPQDGGCKVDYTMSLERGKNPLWRMSWPVLKQMAFGMMLPMFQRRGLRNLVARAESAEG
jgi:hypothetical protein